MMFKKTLSLLLISIFLTGTATVNAVSSFPDVEKDDAHQAAIEFLEKNGIVKGYDDGTFKPMNTINRAEALKLIFLGRQLLQIENRVDHKEMSFSDVEKDGWYFEYVQEAYDLGIVKGYEDGLFKPDKEITTAESLKIIYLGLLPNVTVPEVAEKPYTDVAVDAWYAPYVEFGRTKFLVEAYGDDYTFKPDRNMTRGDFAEAFYRALYMRLNDLDKYPLNLNWPVCVESEDNFTIKKPYNWTALKAGDHIILWKRDVENSQVSFARLFPNSAVAMIVADNNPKKYSLSRYLELIQYGEDAKKEIMTLNDLPFATFLIEKSGLQDSYFEMPDGKILIVYAQSGDGPMGEQLREEIRYIIASVRSISASSSLKDQCFDSELVDVAFTELEMKRSDLMAAVLVEGEFETVKDNIEDLLLFDTDSIGIGTGPIDYYHSKMLDLTIKVERESNTILAVEEGESSSF